MKIKSMIAAVIAMFFAGSLAFGGTSVIVSKSTQTGKLSVDDIKSIFLGQSKNFPNGERASPCAHRDSSVSNDFFKAFAGMKAKKAKAKWTKLVFTGRAKKPQSVQDDEESVEFVNDNDGAICFVKTGNEGSAKVIGKK